MAQRKFDSLRQRAVAPPPESLDVYLTFAPAHGQAVLNELFARYVARACPEDADERACLKADAQRKLVLDLITRFEEQRRVADGGSPKPASPKPGAG